MILKVKRNAAFILEQYEKIRVDKFISLDSYLKKYFKTHPSSKLISKDSLSTSNFGFSSWCIKKQKIVITYF